MLTILIDGIAYGMLLFVLACGLSVTLGLMNLINLAHGVFAMAGGYAAVVLVNRLGMPFAAALPLAFLIPAVVGAVMERALYRDPEQDLNALWWDLVERLQCVARPERRDAPDWASKIHFSVAPVLPQLHAGRDDGVPAPAPSADRCAG